MGRNMNKAQLKNGNFYKVRALTHHGVGFLSVQKTSQKLSRFVLFFKFSYRKSFTLPPRRFSPSAAGCHPAKKSLFNLFFFSIKICAKYLYVQCVVVVEGGVQADAEEGGANHPEDGRTLSKFEFNSNNI